MLERLICAVLGHRYVVERVMNHGARKVGCTRCGKHWAMHDATRSFVPWDGEFESLYAPGGILAEASCDVPPNAKSQATDAASSRQVACTDGLGGAVPPAPTFEQGDKA